jgi:topoisomerase-4 subunit A
VPADGDHVATIGENRKLLVFPLEQLPEMARGKGVRLQRYKDGGLVDAKVFKLADGLTWTDSAGRNFTIGKAELREWIGNRAEAGRLPPRGFPKNNRFG